jgi:hypothetical protein
VWEDATDNGLIAITSADGVQIVALTDKGRAVLDARS